MVFLQRFRGERGALTDRDQRSVAPKHRPMEQQRQKTVFAWVITHEMRHTFRTEGAPSGNALLSSSFSS